MRRRSNECRLLKARIRKCLQPAGKLLPTPLERIAIRNPTQDSLLDVACAFAGYNAIRRSPLFTGVGSVTLPNALVFSSRSLFAEAFVAAALSAGHPCRASCSVDCELSYAQCGESRPSPAASSAYVRERA